MTNSKQNQVTVQLEPDDYATLCELAKDGDRSNAAQARRMLRGALRNSHVANALPIDAVPEERDAREAR